MIDLILTTRNRLDFLKVTLTSLLEMNKQVPYRLVIYDDCSDDGTPEYLMRFSHPNLFAVILAKQRMGVVHGFNQAWNYINELPGFLEYFPYMGYLQDDVKSLEGEWLLTSIRAYEALAEAENIGFLSAYDAPEHPKKGEVGWEGKGLILKDSISFQNAMAPKDFWESIGKVPAKNPDGTARGYPGEGKGSQIDVYMTGCMSQSKFVTWASAEKSSMRQGKKVLVLPGMLEHLGIDPKDSTWRNGYR
jgi:glycosyltransferase involved in cell wall biosynthesis